MGIRRTFLLAASALALAACGTHLSREEVIDYGEIGYSDIVSYIVVGYQTHWEDMDPTEMNLSPVYTYSSPYAGFTKKDIDLDGYDELLIGEQWGSSPYFFQPMVQRYVKFAGKAIGNASLRALMHTKASDKFYCLKIVDGYVSPLEFLNIETAESIFRDAKQYFYLISRKVESYSEVAKSIGEAIYYNDNDLYIAAMKISAENYNCRDPKILPAAEKIELARRLYFDYNAGEKQLQRLISIDANLLKAVL